VCGLVPATTRISRRAKAPAEKMAGTRALNMNLGIFDSEFYYFNTAVSLVLLRESQTSEILGSG
jgi:hypothetical protein